MSIQEIPSFKTLVLCSGWLMVNRVNQSINDETTVRCSSRNRTKFGERAFSHAGPATWNALSDHIRTVADPVKFRKLLKSHYFSQAVNIC